MTTLPKQLGCYRLAEALGQGGMGVVYRAEHTTTREQVALKTVRLPRLGMLSAIRREIRALARLQHPGIIRIVGYGTENGMPWYAMELLRGLTLKDSILQLWRTKGQLTSALSSPFSGPGSSWGWSNSNDLRIWSGDSAALEQEASGNSPFGKPLPRWPLSWTVGQESQEPLSTSGQSLAQLGQAPGKAQRTGWSWAPESLPPEILQGILTLVRKLCEPLSFLHGEGVVHQDLKPANILVLEGNHPVLVDFGLVARFGGDDVGEALELDWARGGTPLYMAPERLQGKLVDARADLYALGCILYELLVGRPPFLGKNHQEVMRAHLSEEPIPPSKRLDGIPIALDELVLGLLQKDPRKRVGYADDVSAALGRLGAARSPETGPRPRPYLYRPVFAGREETLHTLRPCFEDLQTRRGNLVLVGGEIGVGKTRLIMELGKRAQDRAVRVISGECAIHGAPGTQEIPLQGLRKLLQFIGDRCRLGGPLVTRQLLGRRGRILAAFEPSLQNLSGMEELPEPTELPTESARQRLFLYLTATLAELTKNRPLVLILDNLHLADELTLGFLNFLPTGKWLDKMPLLIIGTYRTEGLREELQQIRRRPRTLSLELPRLGRAAVGRLVQSMLALERQPQKEFIQFLARQSEGNPLFVAEYLRTAVGIGILVRNESGNWQVAETASEEGVASLLDALPLPGNLQELILARLQGLSDSGRRLLDYAAILGREFQEDALTTMAQLGEEPFTAAIEELLGQEILKSREDGKLRFQHEKFQQVAYRQIPFHRRRELHQQAARVLGLLAHKKEDRDFSALAYHLERAGLTSRARQAYEKAGDRAREHGAFEEALRLLERAEILWSGFEVQGGNRERAALALKRAHCLWGLERASLALEALSVAEAEARAGLESAVVLEALELRASILAQLGIVKEALRTMEQAMAQARHWPRHTARVLEKLGSLRARLGELATGRILLEQSLHRSQEHGDLDLASRARVQLGKIARQEGDWKKSERLLSLALRDSRTADSQEICLSATFELAVVQMSLRRFTEGRNLARSARTLGRHLGRPWMDVQTGLLLGQHALYRGRSRQSRKLLERALRMARRTGSTELLAWTELALGGLLIDLGQVDEGLRLLEEAWRRACSVRSPKLMAAVRLALGRGCLRAGRISRAEHWIHKNSQPHLPEIPMIPRDHCLLQGQLLLEQGRWPQARESLEHFMAQPGLLEIACLPLKLLHLEILVLLRESKELLRESQKSLISMLPSMTASEACRFHSLEGLLEGLPALESAKKAQSLAKDLRFPDLLGRSEVVLARWHLKHANPGEAQVLAHQALDRFLDTARSLNRFEYREPYLELASRKALLEEANRIQKEAAQQLSQKQDIASSS